MSSTRLGPILFASVTLASLAIILQGLNSAEAKVTVTETVESQSEVPQTQTNSPANIPADIPVSPAPGGITNRISAEQARQHVGETSIVCGLVVGGRYVTTSNNKPTYLNFGRPYPNHTFAVMVPDADRPKFKNPPEVLFIGKTVCVTGMITEFRGKPQIVVKDPSQIVIAAAAPAMPDKTATNTVQKTPTPTGAP